MAVSRASIASLSLRDFRNFERLQLEIPDAGFVLVGENGHGKTNLLESVAYLSLLRSVRGARDADVTRFGAPGFFIEARAAVPATHLLSVGFERGTKRKRVRRDGAVVERLSDALGALPTVMFSPGDVDLVAGAPSARRRYLDIMLALTSRGYLGALQQYRAALERRNAALRDAARHPSRASAIEVWEGPLAQHGAALIRGRAAWVRRVAARFGELCTAIGERGKVELRYAANVDPSAESVEEALSAALAARRTVDLKLGLTHSGPHRDDLTLLLDGRELRSFGSAGQQRTAAIALRMLEAETLRDANDASPVFLFDDPFAELDAARSARVLRLLQEIGLGQTILAVPRDSDIPPALTPLPRFRIVNGAIEGSA
ncbi:MAG TPA: DNA replication and repair protein RecF [Gemmatimonadaceae bacterium]|nr:DNA replication and repair protein RecF [Gemmatimonadaceae bacterium]